MLHLFHGELIEASRKELTTLKEKYRGGEVVSLEGKSLTAADLIQATESGSLFGNNRLVVVENLFSRRLKKKTQDFEEFTQLISRLSREAEIVFWEEKEQPKTILGLFPKSADIALFRPERMIFTFVESLKSGNTEIMLDNFHLAIKKDVPELIFTMIIRQFRYLLMVKELKKEVKELTPWQLTKFMRQAEYFTLEKLIDLYRKILEIDVKIKSGETPFSLTQEIRLFLMEI